MERRELCSYFDVLVMGLANEL